MGRRGVSVHDEERWVFNRLAEAYRSRPGYPDALVARLAELAGGARARVADLGAGTGHLAIPLAARGLEVTAVEPARSMLEVLAAQSGEVRAVHAAAEDTQLEAHAFDLVVLADALQWVDPELAGREAARLLAPGGVCAVVEARLADTPFLRALRALLARHNPKARRAPSRALVQLLSLAAGRRGSTESFVQELVLDERSLSAVLRSLSYVGPALGPAELEQLLEEALRLAREHGGAEWRRELTLAWARRSSLG